MTPEKVRGIVEGAIMSRFGLSQRWVLIFVTTNRFIIVEIPALPVGAKHQTSELFLNILRNASGLDSLGQAEGIVREFLARKRGWKEYKSALLDIVEKISPQRLLEFNRKAIQLLSDDITGVTISAMMEDVNVYLIRLGRHKILPLEPAYGMVWFPRIKIEATVAARHKTFSYVLKPLFDRNADLFALASDNRSVTWNFETIPNSILSTFNPAAWLRTFLLFRPLFSRESLRRTVEGEQPATAEQAGFYAEIVKGSVGSKLVATIEDLRK